MSDNHYPGSYGARIGKNPGRYCPDWFPGLCPGCRVVLPGSCDSGTQALLGGALSRREYIKGSECAEHIFCEVST